MNNEDMKILEERITMLKRHIKYYEESDCKTDIYHQLVEECRALENLLTRNKQLEEENKTQLEAFELGKESSRKRIEYDYIPKSRVKEKIEELKKKVEELTDEKGYWGGSDLLEQIKVLQELLES